MSLSPYRGLPVWPQLVVRAGESVKAAALDIAGQAGNLA
jgi:hypothetical protein